MGFPGGAGVKNPPASAGDTRYVSLIPDLGRFSGIGNGHPLQYFLSGKLHGQMFLTEYSYIGGRKESDSFSLGMISLSHLYVFQ